MSVEKEEGGESVPFWAQPFKNFEDEGEGGSKPLEGEEGFEGNGTAEGENKPISETTIEEPKDTNTFNINGFLEDSVDLLEADGFTIPEGKLYEPTPEGLKELIKDSIEVHKAKLEQEYADRFANKESNTFKFGELDAEDEEHAEVLLRNYYKKTDWDDEEIEEKIQVLKELGDLTKDAKAAQRFLKKEEDREEREANAERERAERAELESQEAFISDIKKQIDTVEEIVGFKPDKKAREDFKDFLFKTGKSGKTKAQELAEDPNHRLRVAWMEFIDFRKEDMEKGIRTELANGQAKKASRFTETSMQGKGTSIKQFEEKEVSVKEFFKSTGNMWSSATED